MNADLVWGAGLIAFVVGLVLIRNVHTRLPSILGATLFAAGVMLIVQGVTK